MTEKKVKEWYCRNCDKFIELRFKSKGECPNFECDALIRFIEIGKEKRYIEKSKLEEAREYYNHMCNRHNNNIEHVFKYFHSLRNLYEQAIEEIK